MVGCFVQGSKMDPRSLCLIVISVGIAGLVNFVLTNPIMDSLESSSEIAKVFSDCKHSDYRTYIQCLKREKRHHEFQNMDPACLDTCVQNCIKMNHACELSCKYCLQAKKTRNRIINITESETEESCLYGNCTKSNEHKPVIVNVTNHIHVHNYYNKTEESTKHSCPCIYITWKPCYCRPQYPICQYQHQWPCIPYGGYGGGFGGGFGGGYVGGYGGGFSGGVGVGVVEVPSVIGNIGSISSDCVCPNQTTRCDECNPAAG